MSNKNNRNNQAQKENTVVEVETPVVEKDEVIETVEIASETKKESAPINAVEVDEIPVEVEQNYSVFAGSELSEADAGVLVEKLTERGFDVEAVFVDDSEIHTVKVASCNTIEDAKKKQRELITRGFSAHIK